MLEHSGVTRFLTEILEKKPEQVERFEFSDNFKVDFLRFNDRPYKGVNSLISNGVSEYCSQNKLEFIVSFDEGSVSSEIDLGAFLATYIQLHYIENHRTIDVRDFFNVSGKLFKGFDYIGVYAASPCYFPEELLTKFGDIKLLWLIPLYQNEYDYIEKFGAEAFEDFLEKNDPDLSIFNRQPLSI